MKTITNKVKKMTKDLTTIPQVRPYSLTLGCDPEFFFKKGRKIIGSEKVITIGKQIDSQGLEVKHNNNIKSKANDQRIIIDGVQAELNTYPSTCRALLSGGIRGTLRGLNEVLTRKNLKMVNKPMIKLSKKELNSLSDVSKEFGCAPSLNAQGDTTQLLEVNPAEYQYRPAGGHIHLGLYKYTKPKKATGSTDK